MQGLLIRLIVIKKVMVASLLLVLSVAAAVGSQDMGGLEMLADVWAESDRRLLEGLARRALALGPDALRGLVGVAAVNSVLVYLAAWAAWTDRRWGDWLLVALLVVPLPRDLIALFLSKSPSDVAVLGLTLLVLTLMLRRALRR